MKQETKELIKWAMSLIADYRVQNMVEHSNFRKNTPAAQNSEIEIKNCIDFAEFLDSLPEIESHLCNGGYIQDSNGTPCCHGDHVKFKINHTPDMERHIEQHGVTSSGTLQWNKTIRAFVIKFDDATWDGDWIAFDAGDDDIEWFEKV